MSKIETLETRPYFRDNACWCHVSIPYHQQVCRSLRGVPTDTLYQQALSTLLVQHAQEDEMTPSEDPGSFSPPLQKG